MIMAAFILVSALGGQSPASAPTSAPDLETFLAEYARSQAEVNTFRARFIQIMESSDDPYRTAGTLVYTRPRRLVYRTNEMVTIVDGGTSYEYEKDLAQVLVDDIAGTPLEDLFFFGFDANMENLRDHYVLRVFEESDDPIGSRRLSIKPKPKDQEATPFVEVVIAFRDDNFMPHNIRIQNDEDVATTYILNQYDLNVELSEPELQIVLPEGTIIVKRGEVVEEVNEAGTVIPPKEVAVDPTLPGRLREAAPGE